MNDTSLNLVTITNQKDFMVLARLAEEIWRECFENIIPDEQEEEMLALFQSEVSIGEAVLHKGYKYYYVHKNNEHIGYISFKVQNNVLLLNTCYLKSNYFMQQEYMNEICLFLLNMAKGQHLQKIYLRVTKIDTVVIDKYQKAGFVIQYSTKSGGENSHLLDDFIMELPI